VFSHARPPFKDGRRLYSNAAGRQLLLPEKKKVIVLEQQKLSVSDSDRVSKKTGNDF
jgi:hypothetical protein